MESKIVSSDEKRSPKTMADSSARAQRAAEIEKKKKKLEELKKRREKRKEDTKAVTETASANLDEVIDDILSEPPVAGSEKQPPQPSSAGAIQPTVSKDEETNGDIQQPTNVVTEPAPAPPPKKSVETFTVGTQTDDVEDLSDQEDDKQQPEASKESPLELSTDANETKAVEDLKVLKDKDLEHKISNEPFSSFINTTSKKVERLLGTTPILSQILVDFVGEQDNKQAATSDASKFVHSKVVYECPKWTAGRDVTDVDWSPLHRDLVLSSYQSRDPTKISDTAVSQTSPDIVLSSSLTPRSGELQSDGLVLVWSLSMPKRPEHIFTCGSPVTVARFHPTESTWILGGCASGQLVVWDLRSGRLPVQKSSLTTVTGASSNGHTHPINTMTVIEGGAGLVTTSTDGRVNFWSLSNLREPAESLQVGDSVSSLAIAPESENLLLADENGTLYTIEMNGQQRRRQAKKLHTADAEGENLGHFGLVTSLSTKSLKKSSTARAAGLTKGFLRGSGGLVLSSGVDWTVKLWGPAYSEQPLTSIVSHSYDYMSDVMWSPMHPSVFATASSNGTIGLWNLATSFEEPMTGVEGIVVEPDANSGTGLNKLRWSSDGHRLAVASSDRVHVLTLSEEIVKTKGDEDTKIMNHLLSRRLIERP